MIGGISTVDYFRYIFVPNLVFIFLILVRRAHFHSSIHIYLHNV